MRFYVFLIVLVVGMIACKSSSQKETPGTQAVASNKSEAVIHRVDNAAFAAKIADSDAQLVDVRTPDEHAEGAIENSTNINYRDNNFAQEANSKLDKNKPVLLYCAGGVRSAKAAKILKKQGFTEIYDLENGYGGWK